jgi:hypothetical protein
MALKALTRARPARVPGRAVSGHSALPVSVQPAVHAAAVLERVPLRGRWAPRVAVAESPARTGVALLASELAASRAAFQSTACSARRAPHPASAGRASAFAAAVEDGAPAVQRATPPHGHR